VEAVAPTWAFLFMLLAGGGVGLPLGVPPLPPDRVVTASAPEDCVFYFSSAGMAKADPRSTNQTERLLAEPEVRHLGTEIERLIRSGLKQAAQGKPAEARTLAEDGPTLVRALLTRPLALYVTQIKVASGQPPQVQAGAVLSLGDDAAEVQAALDRLYGLIRGQSREITVGDRVFHQTPLGPGAPEITWGVKGSYLYAATSGEEVKALVNRADGKPPEWLDALHKQLPVERVSTLSMVNVHTLIEQLAPLGGPRVSQVLDALGVSGIDRLSGVSGLDKDGIVHHSLVSLRGEPHGIFQLFEQKPLTTADVGLVPRDATFALVFKLDPARAWATILTMIEKIDPKAKQQLTEHEHPTARELREEALKALGDTWCLFDSPSGGGMVVGVTVVVSLKDAEAATSVQEKLIRLAASQGARVREFRFAGQAVHVFDAGKDVPLAPSWCRTDRHLVIGLYPEAVKAFLARRSERTTLAQLPEVAAALKGEGQLVGLSYCDTRRVFDLTYPFFPVLFHMATAHLRDERFDIPPGLLPSAGAIRRHLRPSVSAVWRTPHGIESESRQSLPGGAGMSTLPVALGLLIPAVQKVREAAQRINSANNLKQIGIAMHNYHDTNGTFPPAAITSEDGKPLLSWRVAILPYLEQQALYKEFHLDEPWDSPHNMKLLERMPKVYFNPRRGLTSELGSTYYQVFVSKREPGERSVFQEGGPSASLTAITNTDGTAYTWLAIEADEATPWTKPGDIPYSPKRPLPRLGRLYPGGYMALFADGSVRTMRPNLPERVIRALITFNDGVELSEKDLGP
jgi:hypothetical protein